MIQLSESIYKIIDSRLSMIPTYYKNFYQIADSLSLAGATIGLIGDYNDPQFGRTRAALALQLVPKATLINLETIQWETALF